MVLSNAQWFANPGVTYEIDYSCRFNDDDSAYLYKTPDATNQKTWTFSTWFKIGNLGGGSEAKTFLAAGTDGGGTGAGYTVIRISESDAIYFEYYASSAAVWKYVSNQVLRDPGAWYHLVVAVDTTQGAAGNRIRIYLNGSEVTSFSTETDPSADTTGNVGANILHRVGSASWGVSSLFDGYMAETIYIDGTQLTPSSFGETNSTTGQWVPKSVSGLTFGTEGFLFAYQDSSALGDDTSGNGNDWTSSGLASNDQMPDTPTDNYCTWHALNGVTTQVLSNGNLTSNFGATGHTNTNGTMALPPSGKWFWEIDWEQDDPAMTTCDLGVVNVDTADTNTGTGTFITTGMYGYRDDNGNFNDQGTQESYGDSYTDAVISIAWDADNGNLFFAKDGTWQNSATQAEIEAGTGTNAAKTGLTGISMAPHAQSDGLNAGPRGTLNCGQSSFTATKPTGFSTPSTANFDDPTIADPSAYVQATTYTGDGASSLAVNQAGNSTFEPGWVWIKNRPATASDHCLFDSVRGVTKLLTLPNITAETTDADTLTAFDADGFTVGADTKVNTDTEGLVAWQWVTDGTSGSSNEDGDITSTVSKTTTAGFSVFTYTGNGTAGQTVGHGLGVKPDFMIFKKRTGSVTTGEWGVYHSATGAGKRLQLQNSDAASASGVYWNSTEPTSSVVTLGNHDTTNLSGATYVAYVFCGVEGYSKFGSYESNNNADGPFIWCGIKPAYLLLKNSDGAANWEIRDNSRSPYNVASARLLANSDGEEDNSSTVDFLSNGFNLVAANAAVNPATATIIFAAFAESPFQTATAR